MPRSNVKGQGHQGQKRAVHSEHIRRVDGMERLNGLVADNVAQAAGAATRLLQRGVFAGMRALGLAGYGLALSRISSFLTITWSKEISETTRLISAKFLELVDILV